MKYSCGGFFLTSEYSPLRISIHSTLRTTMIDRLLFTIKGVRAALINCTIFSLITSALVMGQAFFLTTALTNLWYNHPLEEQAIYLAFFAVCLIARQVADNIQSGWLESFATKRADEFRTGLFETLFKQGQTLIQSKGTGSFSTLLVEGVDQVEAYLRMIIPRMTRLVVIPVMLLVLLFTLDWVSAVIGLLVFPAIILQMVLIGHTASIEAGKQHKEYQRLANHFLDSVRGIDTLKLFGRSKDQTDSIFTSSERFRAATMKTLRVATLSGAVLDAFSTISIAAIAVMLGFRLVDGSLTLFPALFVLVLMPDYFRPIREFASDYHASLDGKNSLHAILETLHADTGKLSDAETKDSEKNSTVDADLHTDPRTSVDIAWSDTSTLLLNDISFQYASEDEEAFSLQNITASFLGAQKIGIIGASGSGKSTLAHILAGLNDPESGTITVNGVTVSTLKDPRWQHQIAYIPQNPHIFNTTLRNNIAFYKPDASQEEIERICSLMGLDSLLAELPQGIDTVIGEGAHSLSGGQSQRIAFARAFLNENCKVLIFDEPTAHLDIETELELKERMLSLMENKLVFFATHRLHWLSAMDSVLLLQNGHLIAQDSAEALRKNLMNDSTSSARKFTNARSSQTLTNASSKQALNNTSSTQASEATSPDQTLINNSQGSSNSFQEKTGGEPNE